MATNRFTNLSKSSFNPLSLEEIMMVPLARQEQHETEMINLANAGLFDVNRLKNDDVYVGSEIEKLKSNVSSIEDEIMTKGVSRGLTKRLMDVKKAKEDFLSNDGIGGRAQNNYNSYLANVKEIQSNANLSQSQKDAGLRKALYDYERAGGVEAGAGYSAYRGANFVNIQDKARKIASELKPQEITRMTGWKEDIINGTKVWTNGTTTTEKLPASVIEEVVNRTLMNDSEVIDYLRDAQQIGLIQDPTSHLRAAGINAGLINQVNNVSTKQDMKFAPKDGSDDGSFTPNSGISNYIMPPFKENIGNSTLTWANRIGKPKEPVNDGRNTYGMSIQELSKRKGIDRKPYTIDDLPKEKSDELYNIAKGLKKKGLIDSINLHDEKNLKAVTNYLEEFHQDINRIGIQNDFSGGVGMYSTGINTKDYNAVLNAVQINGHRSTYKHPVTGKNYTWDELKAEFGVEKIEAIEGYVDADNGLPDTDNPKSDIKAEWVSPQVVSLKTKDGTILNGFYKTRDGNELNSPRYKEDVNLNRNIFGKVKTKPMIPQEVNYLGKDIEMTYIPEKQYMEILQNLQNDIFDQNGEIKPNADSRQILNYQSMIQASQNSGSRQGIYELKKDDGSVFYADKRTIQSSAYDNKGIQY